MKYYSTVLLLFLLVLSEGCISTSTVEKSEKNLFPTVTGTNLHGEEKTLPDCLEKDYTILVVAYQRWQQELCDEWYEEIADLMSKNASVAYFEVPTISKMNGFMRWFIYRGMRGGITDPVMRKQVVTLHIDKEPFNSALNIDTEETVHVFVVDKRGEILSRVKGKFEDKKWQSLTAVIKEKDKL